MPTYTQSAAMNIAETQRIPKQMQIRLQREEGKMEFAGRPGGCCLMIGRFVSPLCNFDAARRCQTAEGVFFILKLRREADPPARFAKATCGLSARRVLEKRPNSRFIRADPVKSVLSYTLFVFPPQDAIVETISF